MKKHRAFVAWLGASVIAAIQLGPDCVAQEPVLSLHSNDIAPGRIFKVDLTTGQNTVLFNLSQPVTAAAFNPMDHKVYCVCNNDTLGNPLIIWDPATGQESQLPGIGIDFARMGCAANGWIYAVKLNSALLYRIDPATGAATNLGPLNTDTAGSSGDLAFPPGSVDDFYYLLDTKFYRVNIPSMTATFISAPPFPLPTGLAFSEDGRLWASDNNNLYEMDPATGSATLVGPFNTARVIDMMGALAPLFLHAVPRTVTSGSTLKLQTLRGEPGRPVATVVTQINGVPFYEIVLIRRFNALGQAVINTTAPALAGTSIGVVSVGFAWDGRLVQTNEELISIQ